MYLNEVFFKASERKEKEYKMLKSSKMQSSILQRTATWMNTCLREIRVCPGKRSDWSILILLLDSEKFPGCWGVKRMHS